MELVKGNKTLSAKQLETLLFTAMMLALTLHPQGLITWLYAQPINPITELSIKLLTIWANFLDHFGLHALFEWLRGVFYGFKDL